MVKLRDYFKIRLAKKSLSQKAHQETPTPLTYSGWFSFTTAEPAPESPGEPTQRSHIILVHGIGGHWKESWEEQGFSWIDNFLQPDLRRHNLVADVWSYGYDSRTMTNTVATIEDVAVLLLEWMHARRLHGPIIFVAHSLGGLVVKKAIVMAQSENARYGEILNSIRGCVFLGVPHRGADNTWWMTAPATMIRLSTIGFRGNAQFAESIERMSPVWREISSSFIPRTAALITIHSFFETRKTGPAVLVDKESALMGLGNEIRHPTDSDHVNINKFGRGERMRYELVGNAIIELLRQAKTEVVTDQESESPQQSLSQLSTAVEPPNHPLFDIADNGTFVGGDEVVATRTVAELWHKPARERIVRVRASPLEDESYMVNSLDAYVKLRASVELFQNSVNFFLQEHVHYYLEWEPSNVANAILHLRSLALPGLGEREAWFAWPLGKPSEALRVYFSRDIGNFMRSGYYDDRSVDLVKGMPPDRPIWLKSVFPHIVWERVAPAAALQAVEAAQNPGGRLDVDLSNWVLSNRPPSELERDRPTDSTMNESSLFRLGGVT